MWHWSLKLLLSSSLEINPQAYNGADAMMGSTDKLMHADDC